MSATYRCTVIYECKDDAKKLGCKWNNDKREWTKTFPAGHTQEDIDKFKAEMNTLTCRKNCYIGCDYKCDLVSRLEEPKPVYMFVDDEDTSLCIANIKYLNDTEIHFPPITWCESQYIEMRFPNHWGEEYDLQWINDKDCKVVGIKSGDGGCISKKQYYLLCEAVLAGIREIIKSRR